MYLSTTLLLTQLASTGATSSFTIICLKVLVPVNTLLPAAVTSPEPPPPPVEEIVTELPSFVKVILSPALILSTVNLDSNWPCREASCISLSLLSASKCDWSWLSALYLILVSFDIATSKALVLLSKDVVLPSKVVTLVLVELRLFWTVLISV